MTGAASSALDRARRWLGRIMISWGIVAAASAAVTSDMQFYVVRFALGLAEAGFFPGVIVYLTHWFPQRDRARALAYFIIAQPIAYLVSPRLSAPMPHRDGSDRGRRGCSPPGVARARRLAMGLHHVGRARRVAGPCRALRADRSTVPGAMADTGRARSAGRRARPRAVRARRRRRARAFRRCPPQPGRAPAGSDQLPGRHRTLRRRVLPVDHSADVVRPAARQHALADRVAVRRAPRQSAGRELELRSDR
jgi:Major Facilitator Superfamily